LNIEKTTDGFDTKTPSLTHPYDADKSLTSLGAALKVMIYENGDTTNCEIKSCSLKKEGCTVDYDSTFITMEDYFPFNVQAKANIPEGFAEKFCIQCQNYVGNQARNGMMVSRDQITVTQEAAGTLWWIWVVVAIVVLGGGSAAFLKYRNDQ